MKVFIRISIGLLFLLTLWLAFIPSHKPQALVTTSSHQGQGAIRQSPSQSPERKVRVVLSRPLSNEASLEASKKWDEYEAQKDQALPTQEGQWRRNEFLQDPQMIQYAITTLIPTQHENLSSELQEKRIHVISYLNQALMLENNPERETVLESISDLLSKELLVAGESPRNIKSWMGDRIELYSMLFHYDLDRAIELAKTFESKVQKEIVRQALNEIKARLAPPPKHS